MITFATHSERIRRRDCRVIRRRAPMSCKERMHAVAQPTLAHLHGRQGRRDHAAAREDRAAAPRGLPQSRRRHARRRADGLRRQSRRARPRPPICARERWRHLFHQHGAPLDDVCATVALDACGVNRPRLHSSIAARSGALTRRRALSIESARPDRDVLRSGGCAARNRRSSADHRDPAVARASVMRPISRLPPPPSSSSASRPTGSRRSLRCARSSRTAAA